MMAKKDIHKIDNILFIAGPILFLIGLCVMVGSLALGIFLMLGSLAMLTAGFIVRTKENRVIAIWNMLERATEVSIPDLINSTGFERPFIQEAVQLINTHTPAFYVLDLKADRIVDGRLRTQMVMVENCPSCGAKIGKTITLDLSQKPGCPYCNSQFSGEQLNQMKLDAVERIRDKEEKETDATSSRKFKIYYFIPLLLLGWPLAVVYALWAYGIINPKKS